MWCQRSALPRITILELAADWHELMIPQRTMLPSIARVNERLNSPAFHCMTTASKSKTHREEILLFHFVTDMSFD